ncbi:hypothetical protein [Rubritalea tangerina]|uniref:hypothetical protein n=1 Tax=Rubritalea tangerina TaxID=430798 RepID=UPI003617970D
MKLKKLILSGLLATGTLTTLNSCVEAVALGVMAGALDEDEPEQEIPPLIMHDGPKGRYPHRPSTRRYRHLHP